jgi:hypothetical protein
MGHGPKVETGPVSANETRARDLEAMRCSASEPCMPALSRHQPGHPSRGQAHGRTDPNVGAVRAANVLLKNTRSSLIGPIDGLSCREYAHVCKRHSAM